MKQVEKLHCCQTTGTCLSKLQNIMNLILTYVLNWRDLKLFMKYISIAWTLNGQKKNHSGKIFPILLVKLLYFVSLLFVPSWELERAWEKEDEWVWWCSHFAVFMGAVVSKDPFNIDLRCSAYSPCEHSFGSVINKQTNRTFFFISPFYCVSQNLMWLSFYIFIVFELFLVVIFLCKLWS